MAKYILTEWERNGYHDSDFYASYWDSETESIRCEEVGTTRCYSRTNALIDDKGEEPGHFTLPTIDIVLQAIKKFEEFLFSKLKASNQREIMEPSSTCRNDRLRLLSDGEFKDKKRGTVIPYKAGESGVVIWADHIGTFYHNGFNKRGRHNLRVGLRLDDGRIIFVPMEKLRKDKEVEPDSVIRKLASQYAQECGFSNAMFGAAWDSRNYALDILKKNQLTTKLGE